MAAVYWHHKEKYPKPHLWRFEGVVCGEVNSEEKHSTLVRTVILFRIETHSYFYTRTTHTYFNYACERLHCLYLLVPLLSPANETLEGGKKTEIKWDTAWTPTWTFWVPDTGALNKGVAKVQININKLFPNLFHTGVWQQEPNSSSFRHYTPKLL